MYREMERPSCEARRCYPHSLCDFAKETSIYIHGNVYQFHYVNSPYLLGMVGFWHHVWCSTSSCIDAHLGVALVPGDRCHTPCLGAPALPGMKLEFEDGGAKLVVVLNVLGNGMRLEALLKHSMYFLQLTLW